MGRSLRGLLIGSTIAFACTGSGGRREAERKVAALSAPVTVAFQDGSNGYAGTTDTQIAENALAVSAGTAATLNADGDEPSGSGRDVAMLLRWDLASIPAGSTVQGVSLRVRVTNTSTQAYPVYALSRAWAEATATWQQAVAGSPWQAPGAKGALDRETTTLATVTASATGALTVALNAAGVAKVQQWVDDPASNFGLIVASASNTDGVDIASSETTTAANRPVLTITYAPPSPPPIDAGGSDAGGGAGGAAGGADGAVGGAAGVDGTGGAAVDAGGTGVDAAGGSAAGGTGVDAAGGSGVDAAGGSGVDAAGGIAPAVLYAVGDIGNCSSTGDTATALLLDGSTDPIAVLGDIAYPNGSTADFADCFDPPWGRHRPRIRPVPGNHEYNTSGASGYYGYFGAAAGDPIKGYYSYDVGAWHVVAINSNCSAVSCAAGSAQEQWLRQDLAAHPAACTLAYWHHPRFSSGHNGNASSMAAIWQALHDLGADVVLAGHDHGYQRLGPLNPSGRLAANGMLELVVGTGGAELNNAFSGTKPSNVIVRNGNTFGVLKLTLRPTGYDWQFIPVAGQTFTDAGSANCR